MTAIVCVWWLLLMFVLASFANSQIAKKLPKVKFVQVSLYFEQHWGPKSLADIGLLTPRLEVGSFFLAFLYCCFLSSQSPTARLVLMLSFEASHLC